MGQTQLTDRNGNLIPLENTSLPGGNVSFSAVLTDVNGNKAQMGPGSIALLATGDNVNPTYWCSVLAFTPVATPTDILQIQGSATKVVRLKRIKMSGVATAAGNMPAQLLRRSSAASGSTPATVSAAKADVNFAAATSIVTTMTTTNPTTGTLVGVLRTGRIQMAADGSGVAANELVWDFSTRFDSAGVLRGASDFFCINLNGAAVPAGGVIDIEIELEEV